MYTHLAHFYDWPGALDFSRLLFEKTREFLADQHITPPATILDLACGTGTMTLLMAEAGYKLKGLDCSEPMLSQARKKAAQKDFSHPPTWLKEDMRSFNLGETFPAILCYYDSLNHLLTESDLHSCFQQVFQHLAHGGWFLFDLNTDETYQHLWEGNDTSEGPNYRLHFNNTYTIETGRAIAQIKAETYEENGVLTTAEDEVIEQFYENSAIEDLLRQTGFQSIHYENYSPIELLEKNQPLKTWWAAQK